MSCEICENGVGSSSTKNPFVPPNGDCNTIKHVCSCGQIWLQMNVSLHLWQPETQEGWEAWERELRTPEPNW